MADINQIITLGIGTPSDIPHFVLFGLSPTGPVASVDASPDYLISVRADVGTVSVRPDVATINVRPDVGEVEP